MISRLERKWIKNNSDTFFNAILVILASKPLKKASEKYLFFYLKRF